MKSKQLRERGVYQLLDWLETERPQCIKLFWSCVFKDHILLQYPVLRLLRNSLLDGSFHFSENLPEKEERMKGEQKKKVEDKQSEKKRGKKGKESVEEEQPGPSTQSTPSKKTQKPTWNSPNRKGVKEEKGKWALFRTRLPVTCGDKKGNLHRPKLARGKMCIQAKGRWFSPRSFEDFGGRKSNRNWKKSIRCQNTPLLKLIQEGHLDLPCSRPQQSLTNPSEQRKRVIPSRSEDNISGQFLFIMEGDRNAHTYSTQENLELFDLK
ncbi:hypothetical protein AAFF_G00310560 [Aldrovandia affinis]|uniref:SAND domain-containing protein n=1 Tax=Aldrovandia affinis TaxID=143900 RepID=A0AAD7R8H2_9TELE|nr:hypothetical protein AAFF_G00310560 [Aldrovandia affinis]